MGIYAVSRDDGLALAHISEPPDGFGVAYRTFSSLADEGIDVDLILQTSPSGGRGKVGIAFTIVESDAYKTEAALKKLFADSPKTGILVMRGIVKLSVSGIGMRGAPGVAARVLGALWSVGVETYEISTSEIKISILIEEKFAAAAMDALTKEFEMDL